MSDYDGVQVSGQRDSGKCSAVQLVTVGLKQQPCLTPRSWERYLVRLVLIFTPHLLSVYIDLMRS